MGGLTDRLASVWYWLDHPEPPPTGLQRFDDWYLAHLTTPVYALLVLCHLLAYAVLWWQRRRWETWAARTLRWFAATGALIWIVLWSYAHLPDGWFLWSRFGLVLVATITLAVCLAFPAALIGTYVVPAFKSRRTGEAHVPVPVETALLPPKPGEG